MFIFIFLCVLSRKVSVPFFVGSDSSSPVSQSCSGAVVQIFCQSNRGNLCAINGEEEGRGEILLLPSVETEPLTNFYLLTYFLPVF